MQYVKSNCFVAIRRTYNVHFQYVILLSTKTSQCVAHIEDYIVTPIHLN